MYGRNYFEPPEYNLADLSRLEDLDSFVSQGLGKKLGLMFKAGYDLTGKDPLTIQYIKKRLNQIERAQKKAMYILLREIGSDLLKFHNAYLVKVRRTAASGGRVRKDPEYGTVQPVAGYFRMTPETVWVRRDIYGNVLEYRQQIANGVKREFFQPADVIHFYVNRKGGISVGTPSLVPVIDDVRALRRMEENVEQLLYSHLFPLLQYIVGTEKAPASMYPDGTSEIDAVRLQVEMMPAEGCIVTPERHEIRAIGSEGKALRADYYLDYFKHRVFSGMGMSAVDFGEGAGANRSTAEQLSRSLVDNVKDYQGIFASFFNTEIIKELLLEGDFNFNPLDEDHIVHFVFNEIDQDSMIKRDSNTIGLYQSNLVTESEARINIGRQPLTDEERKDMYFERVEKPKAIIQAVDEPYGSNSTSNKAATTGGGTKQTNTGTTPAGRKAGNTTRPTNQHGTKTGPEKKLSRFQDAIYDATAEKLYTILYRDLCNIASEKGFDIPWMRQICLAAQTQLQRHYQRLLRTEFYKQFPSSVDASSPRITVAHKDLAAIADRYVDILFKAVISLIEQPDLTVDRLRAGCESMAYRSRFFHDAVIFKAQNWGKVHSYIAQGYHFCNITPESDCEQCQQQAGIVSLEHIKIEQIPGFHPGCCCIVSPAQ
jgi:hypothetical protein